MKKYILFLASVILVTSQLCAQQSRVYSQFFMNPFVYNPAYAGVEGHTVLFAMYRQQWTNIDGAPSISHLSFHTPLKGGIGIGATAYNESEGLLNTIGAKASASYLWSIDRKHYLRMGLSVGAGNKTINTDGFDSPSDPAFANLAESSTFTLAEFGATYHFDHFNVGFAVPNLIAYSVVTDESLAPVRVRPFDEVLLKANYRGHINDDFAFEPHVLYRYNANLPNQYEVALITHLKHLVWVGGSYRQDAGFIGLFGTKFKDILAIGLAYDLGNNNFNDLLGSTFEVHLGIHLGSKKRHAQHVSSFIKSHQKSLEEREEEKARKLAQQKALEEKRAKAIADAEAAREKAAQEKADQEAAEREAQEAAAREAELAQQREAARQDSIRQAQQTENVTENTNQEGNTQANETIDNNNVEVENNNTVTATEENPPLNQQTLEELANSDVPRTVQRGSHLLELGSGNYVVGGSFKDFDLAEDFSDELFEKGFRDVIVGYITQDRTYYVVVFRSDDLNQAKAERRRLQQRSGFEKVWLLTVE